MNKNTELRKMQVGSLSNIISILEIDDGWKQLICKIPKDLTSDNFVPKYNIEHIRLIEDAAKSSGRKRAEILLDEWGTSGRIRPTLETLQQIAKKANIWRAVEEIAEMLQEAPPTKPLTGPVAAIEINVTQMLADESREVRLNNMSTAKKETADNLGANGFYNGIGHDPTRLMKSQSDLIAFPVSSNNLNTSNSENNLNAMIPPSGNDPNINASLNSNLNYPRFSQLMVQPNARESYTTAATESSVSSDFSSYVPPGPSKDNNYQHVVSNPQNYQTSIPNLEIFQPYQIDERIEQYTQLVHFELEKLKQITNNFSDVLVDGPYGKTGLIGSGGFGKVYLGYHENFGHVAVKRAHNSFLLDSVIASESFNAEIRYLSHFKHKNIVDLLGYCTSPMSLCIVCKYIDGESLEKRLAKKGLTEKQRIQIMLGTAEGLQYLHNSEILEDGSIATSITDQSVERKNFVHGDVKSANILLTSDCVPKLCDFGISRSLENTFVTTRPQGTSAYMSPEAVYGSITQKNDVFSFGIVLLEILTGLPPIVPINSGKLIIRMYVNECCNENPEGLASILDTSVDKWTHAEVVYEIAQKCLVDQRLNRPSMDEICEVLHKINE